MKDHNRCNRCGLDFGSVTIFDKHREGWRVNRRQELVGECLDPLTLSLVEYDGVWHSPETLERAKHGERLGSRKRRVRGIE